ncbi:hypothetical protein C7M84_020120 [Penaeus vannamei]|uniref:H15 domain-containing protein n=1 Tax=Penaeus vannamei TaxID=6689 RepID=A0A3R7LQZ1_PENVA|nr:hypothetical protein C7M84_020120 [Penaeus vannamei]
MNLHVYSFSQPKTTAQSLSPSTRRPSEGETRRTSPRSRQKVLLPQRIIATIPPPGTRRDCSVGRRSPSLLLLPFLQPFLSLAAMGGIRAQETRAKRPSHPKYSAMVRAAIGVLRERLGSSRQAIQKYILTTYSVKDEKKTYTHIKIALKRGVDSGCLTQIRGSGASGSFKLADARKAESRGPRKTKAHGYVCKKTFVKVAGAENPAGGRQTGQRHLSKADMEERSRMRDFIAREAVTKAKSANRKPAAKKTPAKKGSAKKTAVKKPAAKKTTVNKATAKKGVAKKPSAKKESQKKITKVSSAKTNAKKSATKKTTLKQPSSKKIVKKSATKKTEKKSTNKKVVKK